MGPSSPIPKRAQPLPEFFGHVCCGQMVAATAEHLFNLPAASHGRSRTFQSGKSFHTHKTLGLGSASTEPPTTKWRTVADGTFVDWRPDTSGRCPCGVRDSRCWAGARVRCRGRRIWVDTSTGGQTGRVDLVMMFSTRPGHPGGRRPLPRCHISPPRNSEREGGTPQKLTETTVNGVYIREGTIRRGDIR